MSYSYSESSAKRVRYGPVALLVEIEQWFCQTDREETKCYRISNCVKFPFGIRADKTWPAECKLAECPKRIGGTDTVALEREFSYRE